MFRPRPSAPFDDMFAPSEPSSLSCGFALGESGSGSVPHATLQCETPSSLPEAHSLNLASFSPTTAFASFAAAPPVTTGGALWTTVPAVPAACGDEAVVPRAVPVFEGELDACIGVGGIGVDIGEERQAKSASAVAVDVSAHPPLAPSSSRPPRRRAALAAARVVSDAIGTTQHRAENGEGVDDAAKRRPSLKKKKAKTTKTKLKRSSTGVVVAGEKASKRARDSAPSASADVVGVKEVSPWLIVAPPPPLPSVLGGGGGDDGEAATEAAAATTTPRGAAAKGCCPAAPSTPVSSSGASPASAAAAAAAAAAATKAEAEDNAEEEGQRMLRLQAPILVLAPRRSSSSAGGGHKRGGEGEDLEGIPLCFDRVLVASFSFRGYLP